MCTLTVVIPVFNEVENVALLSGQLAAVFKDLPHLNYRLLFVNDGSTDGTYEKLRQLAEINPHLQILDLSRNFGNQHAVSAGLHYAKGDAVITMDADLQHPTGLVREVIARWEKGAEVVLTRRTGYRQSFGHRAFFWLLSKLSDVELERDISDFRLLDRKVVDTLKTFTEKERFFRGMVHWVGFKRDYVSYQVADRKAGQSSFSRFKLVKLGIVGFTAFSTFPLRLSLLLGVPIFFGSAVGLAYMTVVVLFVNDQFARPLAFVSMINALLCGMILICIGIFGKYLEIVYKEVIGRPSFIVRERINVEPESKAERSGHHSGYPTHPTFV